MEGRDIVSPVTPTLSDYVAESRAMMRTLAAVGIFLFGSVNAYCQSECNDLLRQGVYNRFRELSTASKAVEVHDAICKAYSEYQKDTASGSVKASYKLFSGEAEASAEKVRALGESMCSSSSSNEAASNMASKASDLISIDALKEYNQCRQLETEKNLRIATDYVEDTSLNGVNRIGITLRYTPPPGTSATAYPKFVGVQMTPKNAFVCTGALASKKPGTAFDTAELAMLCERPVAKVAVASLGEPGAAKVHAPAATLLIETAAGNIFRHVPAIVALPEPIPTVDPIGTVVAFAGSITDQTRLPTGWLPCDGRPVSKAELPLLYAAIGTTYGSGTDASGNHAGDFNVPDYRGYFLRGLERGTATHPLPSERRDPDRSNAGQDVGSPQGDELRSHVHDVTMTPGTLIGHDTGSGHPGLGTGNQFIGVGNMTFKTIGPNGGVETRPKNIAVHYLIRVK